MNQREAFVAWCREQEARNAIYIWDAAGELVQHPSGFLVPSYDCSGFVLAGYAAIGLKDLRKTHWSDRLYRELVLATKPQAGDLVFYPRHVMVCLGGEEDEVIGACGGGSDTKTVQKALARDARVKRRPTPRYRNDFLGFRKSPFTDGS